MVTLSSPRTEIGWNGPLVDLRRYERHALDAEDVAARGEHHFRQGLGVGQMSGGPVEAPERFVELILFPEETPVDGTLRHIAYP